MNANGKPHGSHRATFLAVMLTLITLAISFTCMVIFLGPFALYFILVVVALAGLGSIHYVLWGRSFSEELHDQMEEGKRELPPEDPDPWPPEETHPPRRF